MKILNAHNFIMERIKVQPITNAELDSIQKEFQNKNPFELTKDDLVGQLANFPMGVVVRMLEEQVNQNNNANVSAFQCYKCRDKDNGGFEWSDTEQGHEFWEDVIRSENFDLFFEKYPEYEKYNLN